MNPFDLPGAMRRFTSTRLGRIVLWTWNGFWLALLAAFVFLQLTGRL